MKLYDSKEYLIRQLKTKTYLQIAKENNISKTTIQKKLHDFNLTKKHVSWTEKELNFLKKLYGSGQGVYSALSDRTKSSIYHKANKLKLKSSFRKRYNQVNEHFFEKLNKKSCYLLGWLFSDGNVSKNRLSFSFHLSKKDISILEKFKELLNSEHPIVVRGAHVEFRVNSKKMCEDLILLGCTPHKTKTITFPKNIPTKYISHFVRGYFEGDGGIYIQNVNTIKVRISGNRNFINGLREKTSNMLKIRPPKLRSTKRGVWHIEFYGDNARKLCRWLYNNCDNLILDRKFSVFKHHLEKLKVV